MQRIEDILNNSPLKCYEVVYTTTSKITKAVRIYAKSEEEMVKKLGTLEEEIVYSSEDMSDLNYKIEKETVEDYPDF